MSNTFKQVSIDHGWKDLEKTFKDMNGAYTKVGLPNEALVADGDATLSELQVRAFTHEFGSPKMNIPERSFMRPAFDDNANNIAIKSQYYAGQIADGKMTINTGLAKIGEFMTNQIKSYITAVANPPLKIRIGGNPLVDSSQLRNSFTHVEVL